MQGVQVSFLVWELSKHMLYGAVPLPPKITKSKKKKRKKRERDGSQVLEKDISWIVKLTKVWKKIYINFKGAENELTVASFLH